MQVKLNSNIYHVTIDNLHCYDYGQKLELSGLDYADNTSTSFIFSRKSPAFSQTINGYVIGKTVAVPVPDAVFEHSGIVEVYLRINSETSRQTEKRITLHVRDSLKPDTKYSPVQISVAKTSTAAIMKNIKEVKKRIDDAVIKASETYSFIEKGIKDLDSLTAKELQLIQKTSLEALSAIPGEYIELADRLNKTISNAAFKAPVVTETACGERIILKDTIDPIIHSLNLYGGSKQYATEGRQLLPYPYHSKNVSANGITFNDNGDGSITVSGTASVQTNYYFAEQDNWHLSPGKYTLQLHNANGLLSVVGSSTSDIPYMFGECINFEVPETAVNPGHLLIYTPPGKPINTTVYPVLVKRETNTDWEPFTGGMPSPSQYYPQEIENTGQTDLWIASGIGRRNYILNTSNHYQNVTAGTNTAKLAALEIGDEIQVGDTITMSVYLKTNSGKSFKARIEHFNSNADRTNIFGTTVVKNDEAQLSLTTTVMPGFNTLNLLLDCNLSAASHPEATVESVKCLKLEIGESQTPWCPAIEDLTSENRQKFADLIGFAKLPDIFRGMDRTQDILTEKDGQIGKLTVVPHIILKSNMTINGLPAIWKSTATEISSCYELDVTAYTLAPPATPNTAYECTSSHFIGTITTGAPEIGQCRVVITNTGNLNIKIVPNPDIIPANDLNAWKAWLDSNHVEVIFDRALDEPIFEPFPLEIQEQLLALKTYIPQTYIYNRADAPMRLTYKTDLQNHVTQKYASVKLHSELEKKLAVLEAKIK